MQKRKMHCYLSRCLKCLVVLSQDIQKLAAKPLCDLSRSGRPAPGAFSAALAAYTDEPCADSGGATTPARSRRHPDAPSRRAIPIAMGGAGQAPPTTEAGGGGRATPHARALELYRQRVRARMPRGLSAAEREAVAAAAGESETWARFCGAVEGRRGGDGGGADGEADGDGDGGVDGDGDGGQGGGDAEMPDAEAVAAAEESRALAAFVRRAVAADAIDHAFLVGTPCMAAAVACVDDPRYEIDHGMLAGEEDRSEDAGAGFFDHHAVGGGDPALLNPDPTGAYLLLDAVELGAIPSRQTPVASPSPSPSPPPASLSAGDGVAFATPKRPRRRSGALLLDSGASAPGVLAARLGDFVAGLREQCECQREAHSTGSATRSGVKGSKAPSRREAASAANVVEELVGLEKKARVGKYDARMEECIADVSSCIRNQAGTFADVLPALDKACRSLREKFKTLQEQAQVLDALRSASVGVLGSRGRTWFDGRGSGSTPPPFDLDAKVGADDGTGDIKGIERDGDAVMRAADTSPKPEKDRASGDGADAPKGDAEAQKADTPTSASGKQLAGGKGDKHVPPLQSMYDRVAPFPVVTPAQVYATQLFLRIAEDAAARSSVANVESVLRDAGTHASHSTESTLEATALSQLAPNFPEFASLANGSSCRPVVVPTYSPPVTGDDRSDSRLADGKADPSPSGSDPAISKAPAEVVPDPVLSNFNGIERIRDMRRQIFESLDQKPDVPSGAGSSDATRQASTQGPQAMRATSGNAGTAQKSSRYNQVEADKLSSTQHGVGLAISDNANGNHPVSLSSLIDGELLIRNYPRRPSLNPGDVNSQVTEGEPVRENADIELGCGPRRWAQARASTSLLLAHGGFVDTSETAVNILTDLTVGFIERIGRTLGTCREGNCAPVTDGSLCIKTQHPASDARYGFSAPHQRAVRSREETLELAQLICSSGFHGGFAELQHYQSRDIPRTSREVREAEERLRTKKTQLAALAGAHLPSRGAKIEPPDSSAAPVSVGSALDKDCSKPGSPIAMEADRPGAGEKNASAQPGGVSNQDSGDGDCFPLDMAGRMFGVLSPSVRLDILDGVSVPQQLVRAIVDGYGAEGCEEGEYASDSPRDAKDRKDVHMADPSTTS